MKKKFALLMIWVFVLTSMIPANVSTEISVGVKEGDWIEYKVTFTGTPPEIHLTGLTVEILGVHETTVFLGSILEYSDGTQETKTYTINIETGSTYADMIIIPANLENGDTFYSGSEYITIGGVENRTYAGVRRTVVYATIAQIEFYWDQATGVLLQGDNLEVEYTLKADKTNMWQAGTWLPIDPILFYALTIAAIVATMAIFVILKRKKTAARRRKLRSRTRRRKLSIN